LAQTASQHSASLQAGVPWGTSHPPAFGSPQVPGSPGSQNAFAYTAQVASHCTEQQNASNWQTVLQQAASSHLDVGCGRKQLPRPDAPQIEQNALASCAQSASQATVQHVLSIAQVLEQHAALLQPGVPCGVRQSPVAGHD
jgi:hypothetical protein